MIRILEKPCKGKSGVTLVELLVAVAALSVVFLAIMRVSAATTSGALKSRKMTELVYAAEMRMEETIGLTRTEIYGYALGGAHYSTATLFGEGTPSLVTGAEAGNYWMIVENYGIVSDDPDVPVDKYLTTVQKEELSIEYANKAGLPASQQTELAAAYQNLVRITITVRMPQRGTETAMSYTLSSVIYVNS